MRNQNPIARLENIIVQDLADESLLYNTETNKAYSLNSTAVFVWSACDGNNSMAEIEVLLEKEYGAKVSEEYIWLTLDLLKQNNLLINADDVELNFSKSTRREIIRKAGLASIVALPVIISLTAPKAAAAASGSIGTCGAGGPSCVNVGSPCTSVGYCIPAGGGNYFFCSVGGVCNGYGSCYGTGTCIDPV